MGWKRKLGIFAVFAGSMIGTMHVINRVITYIATAENYLDKDSYEYYNWRFGKIAYKKKGKGSPVLLVHNFDVCSSSDDGKTLKKNLQKQTLYIQSIY